jgi:hypothetical protein
MSKLGNLVGGVGAVTVFNLGYLPEKLVIGSITDASAISSILVEVDGQATLKLSSIAEIAAYMEFQNEVIASDGVIGHSLTLSYGMLAGSSTTITLTNAGATTPAVYAYSTRQGRYPVLVASQSVIVNSFQRFTNFSALIFPPTNLDYVNVEFVNGFSQKMQSAELSDLYASQNQTSDAIGLYSRNVISGLGIKAVEVYATGGGNIPVTVIR